MKKSIKTKVIKTQLYAEHGEFLALDLGGTNFRVIHCVIDPHSSEPHYDVKYFSVPEAARLGPGEHVSEDEISVKSRGQGTQRNSQNLAD